MAPELADPCPAVLLVVLLARRHPQLNRFQVKMKLWPFWCGLLLRMSL
jgi:hypothetical protein